MKVENFYNKYLFYIKKLKVKDLKQTLLHI